MSRSGLVMAMTLALSSLLIGQSAPKDEKTWTDTFPEEVGSGAWSRG